MVTLEYLKESAIRNRSHTVGRAFCTALGLDLFEAEGWPVDERTPSEVLFCFRNFGSPMDGRR